MALGNNDGGTAASGGIGSSELLPPGVGRIPAWWMECTPHYLLDVDDDAARQIAEDQIAFFYMQLAAADDAGFLGPDGKFKIGSDGKPMKWEGTAAHGALGNGSAHGNNSFGGRTFKAGQAVIDPSLFGINKSDPDYHAYLTGAKLPPNYFEVMAELVAEQNQGKAGNPYGILNNSKQTDYGRYGRQAENPAFKPSWANAKLKKTSQGRAVRAGVYNDSPNKFTDINPGLRRVYANEEDVEDEDPVVSATRIPSTPAPLLLSAPDPAPTQQQNELQHVSYASSVEQNASQPMLVAPVAIDKQPHQALTQPTPSPPQHRSVIRKVRRVRMTNGTTTGSGSATLSATVAATVSAKVSNDDKKRAAAEEQKTARQKNLQKMMQLQMQAAAEEEEAERKRLQQQQQAAAAVAAQAAAAKKQQEAVESELERKRQLQIQQQQQEQASANRNTAPAVQDDLQEKLRRLEELKELKRQQDAAAAAAAAAEPTDDNEYEEETLLEEEVVEEEEVTVHEEDEYEEVEEYTVAEETYVTTGNNTSNTATSINDLQAILAAKQAELAKLQQAAASSSS